MPRNIASEILDGLQEATDYLDGKQTKTRTTTINVPGRVDVRSIRETAILIFGFEVILLRCPSDQHGVIKRQEG